MWLFNTDSNSSVIVSKHSAMMYTSEFPGLLVTGLNTCTFNIPPNITTYTDYCKEHKLSLVRCLLLIHYKLSASLTHNLSTTFYAVILICPNLTFANTHHNLTNDKMKQTALFLYEMLCIREGIFEFCHDRNFLTRSQVDEIIAFLACE